MKVLTVYIEIVFIENLTVDYFILMLCGRLTNSKPKHPWLASLFGALYACVMPLWHGFDGAARILSLAGTVIICFGIKNGILQSGTNRCRHEIIKFIERMLAAIAVTGTLYGLVTLADGGFTENGMIYSSDALMLVSLMCILLSVSLYRAGVYLMRKKHMTENTVMFSVEGVTVEAFVDSGNSLYYNGVPVVLVERSAILEPSNEMPVIIPYSAVGKDGALLGFRTHDATVTYSDRTVAVDCIVALCDQNFGKNFKALLHPDLIGESV